MVTNQEDWERIRTQQKMIADEVARRYGAALTGALGDMKILQRLVDDAVYSVDNTYELQSLGLSFGEVMVKQLGFHWITFADDLGQDPGDPVRRYVDHRASADDDLEAD